MARKCPSCGYADTSTGLHEFTCLSCGTVTAIAEPEGRGRVPNPDGPATYATDPSDAKPEEAKKKAKTKAA